MSKKIKSLSVFRKYLAGPSADNQNAESEEFIVSYTEYHQSTGKPLKDIQYSPQGEPEHIVCYDYDDNGFLRLEEVREGDDELMSKKTFEADPDGNIGREFVHYADGSFDTVVYKYDEQGRLTEKTTFDDEGEQEGSERFEFHGDHLVREVHTDEDGDVVREINISYDEEGLTDHETITDNQEGSTMRREYEYNENGLRKGFIVYDDKGKPVERVLFEYDEQSRPVRIIDENRRQKNTTLMKYDEAGNVVLQEEFDLNQNLVSRIERTYDADKRLLESKVKVGSGQPDSFREYVVRNKYTFY